MRGAVDAEAYFTHTVDGTIEQAAGGPCGLSAEETWEGSRALGMRNLWVSCS